MYRTIKEPLDLYRKEVAKFFQKYFPLAKKEEIEYKDWKDLSIDMGKLIIMQKTLCLSREEIARIMIEAIVETAGLK